MPTLHAMSFSPAPPLEPAPFGPVCVLSTSLLRLELLQHRNSLDLAAAARILLADPGALLHLFSSVAEETSSENHHMNHLESYIASLPFDLLLDRLASHALSSPRQHAALACFADHARCISQLTLRVAGTFQIAADQAALVGSLHELAHLPSVLGWQSVAPHSTKAAALCASLCRQHHVPAWLEQALTDIHSNSQSSLWSAAVSAAHELAATQVNAG